LDYRDNSGSFATLADLADAASRFFVLCWAN
jgi:hypothetical protein